MTQKDNILQELKELESSLVNASLSNIYRVPGNYFEELAGQVMSRIKALESGSPLEELSNSSPLTNTGRINPYQVPSGYFNGLEERLMMGVLQSEHELSASEELESISPLLSGLKKQVPYSVPDNYFETLTNNGAEKVSRPETKVISITARKWFRYAVAATIVGFVALGGILFMNNRNSSSADPTAVTHEVVQKSMKNVSTDELNNFIDLTDQEAPVIASTSTTNNADEIKDLLKNVPDKDIQDFLNETQAAEPDADDSQILN